MKYLHLISMPVLALFLSCEDQSAVQVQNEAADTLSLISSSSTPLSPSSSSVNLEISSSSSTDPYDSATIYSLILQGPDSLYRYVKEYRSTSSYIGSPSSSRFVTIQQWAMAEITKDSLLVDYSFRTFFITISTDIDTLTDSSFQESKWYGKLELIKTLWKDPTEILNAGQYLSPTGQFVVEEVHYTTPHNMTSTTCVLDQYFWPIQATLGSSFTSGALSGTSSTLYRELIQ